MPLGMSRGLELVSKRAGEDDDHPEVEEGEVVVGFAVAAGADPAQCFQPGVRPFDRPPVAGVRVGGLQPPLFAAPYLAHRVAGRERLAGAPRLADPRLDLPVGQCLLVRARGVAAVGPQLGRLDADGGELVEQRQQVAALVLVAGAEQDRQRQPALLDR
jgi:hypothetical protein